MLVLKRAIAHLVIAALASLTLVLLVVVRAHAAPPPTIAQTVGVCDPWYPLNCSAPLGRLKAGGDQYALAIATSTSPTVPSTALALLVMPVGTNNASGQCLIWRDDGTAPTGTVGNPVAAGQPFWYYTKTSASNSSPAGALALIAATGATCVANVLYYK